MGTFVKRMATSENLTDLQIQPNPYMYGPIPLGVQVQGFRAWELRLSRKVGTCTLNQKS